MPDPMMLNRDMSEALQQQVQRAISASTPLNICGGNSKTFLGRSAQGETLDVSGHRGVVEYDPRELVITARAGTPLAEIDATLAASGQMLAFEPPHFGEQATLGGSIACGLSGPRRFYAGAARDSILGCKLLNGKGELLRFGGQVMKNVAGYDLSRLMAGAYGTLGVLLEISLKVLPRPATSLTLVQECTQVEATTRMSQLLSQPLPVDAACYHAGQCYLRLSASAQGVKHAHGQLGGEVLEKPEHFWHALREHRLPFFSSAGALYRIVVKPATPPLDISGTWLLDWGGSQRWLASNEPLAVIRDRVAAAGGHATLFRGGDRTGDVFQPLPEPLLTIHQRLKTSFDPHHIFNRGRMYASL